MPIKKSVRSRKRNFSKKNRKLNKSRTKRNTKKLSKKNKGKHRGGFWKSISPHPNVSSNNLNNPYNNIDSNNYTKAHIVNINNKYLPHIESEDYIIQKTVTARVD